MNDDFPDTLTQSIGVLKRREVEARILSPVIDVLSDKFGRDQVVEVVAKVVIELAKKQGCELSAEFGDSSEAFMETLKFWQMDGALEIEVLEQTETTLNFDVKRCKYAEMYTALGISDFGSVLSCGRDNAMIEGFNPRASLTRDETILSGSERCTFRYDFAANADD